MSTPPIVRLNAPERLRSTLRRFGRDRNPILIIDDVLANPDEVRAHALGLEFRPPRRATGYYPGYLAACSLRGLADVGRWAAREIWRRGFELDDAPQARLDEVETDPLFALLAPAPRRKYIGVHVDGHSWLAMLIYLTPGEDTRSSTAFWRHAPTGLESVFNGPDPARRIALIDGLFGTSMADASRKSLVRSATYQDWVASFTPEAVTRPFPATDHGPWKCIGKVPARYNRLVVYPTWQFHSIAQHAPREPRSLAESRLTLNAFLRHPFLEPIERIAVARIPGLAHAHQPRARSAAPRRSALR